MANFRRSIPSLFGLRLLKLLTFSKRATAHPAKRNPDPHGDLHSYDKGG